MLPNRDNCIAKVWHSTGNWGTTSNCSRKATRDGFCYQHHPDVIEEKKQKEKAASNQRMANRDKLYEVSDVLALIIGASLATPVGRHAVEQFLEAAKNHHATKYAHERIAAEILGHALWAPLHKVLNTKEAEIDGNPV